MERLNKNSTEIFALFVQAMKGQQHLKISNEPYMPLTIEKIGTDTGTEWGFGDLYSFCHYYEQNGDLMQDPEMTFIMVDNRKEEPNNWQNVWVIPISFLQANLGIYQQSGLIEKNCYTKYKPKQRDEQIAFANLWMGNLKEQGFLKQLS